MSIHTFSSQRAPLFSWELEWLTTRRLVSIIGPPKLPRLTYSAAVLTCIFTYFSSKIGVYLFRGGTGLSRKEDKIYLANLCGLIPYLVIAVLEVKFRIHKINSEGQCIIGMKRQTALLVIGYDFIINVDPFKFRVDVRCILQ
jgi:hypothetical protein